MARRYYSLSTYKLKVGGFLELCASLRLCNVVGLVAAFANLRGSPDTLL